MEGDDQRELDKIATGIVICKLNMNFTFLELAHPG